MSDDPASPVCYASHGSDAYLGFASRDKVVATLSQEVTGLRGSLSSICRAFYQRGQIFDFWPAPPHLPI